MGKIFSQAGGVEAVKRKIARNPKAPAPGGEVILYRAPDGTVRAKLRTLVKRILRKHGYPLDKQEKATQTVLQQAELICKDWGEAA